MKKATLLGIGIIILFAAFAFSDGTGTTALNWSYAKEMVPYNTYTYKIVKTNITTPLYDFKCPNRNYTSIGSTYLNDTKYNNCTFFVKYNISTVNKQVIDTKTIKYKEGPVVGVNLSGKIYKNANIINNNTLIRWNFPIGNRNLNEYGRCREYELQKGLCSETSIK